MNNSAEKASAEEKSQKGDQYFQDKLEKRTGLEQIDKETDTVDMFHDDIIGKDQDMFKELAESTTCQVSYDEDNTIVEFIESWEATMKQKKGLEEMNKKLAELNGESPKKDDVQAVKELVRFKEINAIPHSERGYALKDESKILH